MFSSTFGERQLVPSSPGQPRRNPLTTPGVEGRNIGNTGGGTGENVQILANVEKSTKIVEMKKCRKVGKPVIFWGAGSLP